MNYEFKNVCLNKKTVDITVCDGVISSILKVDGTASQVIIPLPIDPHVHLDKTFTASRCSAMQTGLFGAIEAMRCDLPNWSETDLRARMGKALQEAFKNGFTALRSHVDWWNPDPGLAWSVLGELAQEWSEKIFIQRASLTSVDMLSDIEFSKRLAKHVAKDGEVLGCFIYRHAHQSEGIKNAFDLAEKYNLLLDFHVDEGLDPNADAFDLIVEKTAEKRMGGMVLCGHACSLSIRPQKDVQRAIGKAAEAGVALTVLPTTNLQLQDNVEGRTPRLRGIAPMQELHAAGVPVLLGADNVADPFYRMGSYDAFDILRLACSVGHINPEQWLDAITTRPAKVLGLSESNIKVGSSADFLLLKGENWEDALRSSSQGRQIVRSGEIQNLEREAA